MENLKNVVKILIDFRFCIIAQFFFPEYFNLWKEGIMQKVQRI